MKFGIALPHIGSSASTQAIVEVAEPAESLGFDSVWVLDRLLWPSRPSSKYPGNPRGEVPIAMKITYDPFIVLTFVAARTRKVQLGTSVLVAPYRSPLITAKMGATLDQLSGGRLILGIGAGWSEDEFVASGQSLSARQEQTDEWLKAICELWTAEKPSFAGRYYQFPESIFLPQPVQKPRPAIWVGGNSKRAVRRAAELGDAWHPTSRIAPEVLLEEMKFLREHAQKVGRNPQEIALTVRWNASPYLTQHFVAGEVLRKLHEYREVGVQHVCFDFNIPQPSTQPEILKTMERIARDVIPKL